LIDGDRIGRYSIFQYQKVEEGFKYVWVGEFGEYPGKRNDAFNI